MIIKEGDNPAVLHVKFSWKSYRERVLILAFHDLTLINTIFLGSSLDLIISSEIGREIHSFEESGEACDGLEGTCINGPHFILILFWSRSSALVFCRVFGWNSTGASSSKVPYTGVTVACQLMPTVLHTMTWTQASYAVIADLRRSVTFQRWCSLITSITTQLRTPLLHCLPASLDHARREEFMRMESWGQHPQKTHLP